MSHPRWMFTTDLHGSSQAGSIFNGSTLLRDTSTISLTKIVLCHDDSIDSITMHYSGSNSGPVTHGSVSGEETEIVLDPGQFVTCVRGNYCDEMVTQLSFTTNKGINYGPYGADGSQDVTSSFVWDGNDKAPVEFAGRMGLLYFSGRGNLYIRQLSATFALYPASATASSSVKFEQCVPAEESSAPGSEDLSSFARNMMSPLVALHVGPDAVVFHASQAALYKLPFFRGALQHSSEAADKVIRMPEEQPVVIAALLEHIFTGSYTYTHVGDTPMPDLVQGCFHMRVYAVAARYACPTLVADAMHNFVSVLEQLEGMDVMRLWQAAYESGLTLDVCEHAGVMGKFGVGLPRLLKRLYRDEGEAMKNMVVGFPALASDLMRLLVEDCED